MSELDKHDEIQLKALIETFTINEIGDIFSKVDEKILSLMDYSSEDFLKLNNDFKSFYKDNSDVVKNALEVFELLTEDYRENQFVNIKNHFESLSAIVNVCEYYLELSNDIVTKLSNELRMVFFPLKNFKQNLMSLKFLMANLKLSVNCQEEKDCSDFEEMLKIQDANVSDLKGVTDELLTKLNNYRKSLKNYSNDGEDPVLSSLKKIKNILATIKEQYSILEKNNESAQDKIPDIKIKSEELSNAYSDIVTKLQYHDIISQKIVHIQKTHRELIEELIELNKGDKVHLHDHAKFFIRIRDIAGLQAAQLLHANKEYQTAVEIIINKFMDMGDNVLWINNVSKQFVESVSRPDEYENLKKLSTKLHALFNSFGAEYELFGASIKKVAEEKNTIVESYNNISNLTNDIKLGLSRIIKKMSVFSIKNVDTEKSVANIYQLVNEMDVNRIKQRNVFEQLVRFDDSFEQINDHLINQNNKQQIDELDKLFDTFGKVYSHKAGIDKKMLLIDDLCGGTIESIKKSVSEIKYYDYFDKVIEEIITELNSVNFRLKSVETNVSSMEENLKRLKENYTMETEHKIHNQVSEGKQHIEIEIEEDEDNIEFF